MADVINALFELIGSFFTWRNALQLWRERELRGVYWPTSTFFSAWGAWNLIYYPSLGQWWSFCAGIALVTGNIAWVALALRFRRQVVAHG